MFVLFSAGQGQSALDRLSDTDKNPNSVFTRTLLKEMEKPGLSMVQIAKRTFGYRIGEKGKFTDAGLLDALDQRTGTRMPKTSFEMAPDQGKTTIYVTWRDKRAS